MTVRGARPCLLLARGRALAGLHDRTGAAKAFRLAIAVAPVASSALREAYYGLLTTYIDPPQRPQPHHRTHHLRLLTSVNNPRVTDIVLVSDPVVAGIPVRESAERLVDVRTDGRLLPAAGLAAGMSRRRTSPRLVRARRSISPSRPMTALSSTWERGSTRIRRSPPVDVTWHRAPIGPPYARLVGS